MQLEQHDDLEKKTKLIDIDTLSKNLIDTLTNTTETSALGADVAKIGFIKSGKIALSIFCDKSNKTIFDVYTKYCMHASREIYNDRPVKAPGIFEGATESAFSLCLQIGPTVAADASAFYRRECLLRLGELVASTIGETCEEEVTHYIFLGYCGPTSPISGTVSVFAWVPTFVNLKSENSSLVKRFKKLVSTNTEAIFETDAGSKVSNHKIANSIPEGRFAPGLSSVCPMPWCADPVRTTDKDYPIVPGTFHVKLVVEKSEDSYQKKIISLDDLVDIPSLTTSVFYGSMAAEQPIVDHADTNAMVHMYNSPSAMVKELGCCAMGNIITTYDTLPLILSHSFSSQKRDQRKPRAISGNIFNGCRPGSSDEYTVEALLGLISPERLNTSTPRGLMVLAELLEALKSHYICKGSAEPLHQASVVLQQCAKNADVKNYDCNILINFHGRNYVGRPSRSLRVVAHYARVDNPEAFSRLLGTRLWSRLIKVTKIDQTALIAESFAAYLALDHYVVLGRTKPDNKLYRFKDPSYEAVSSPENYINSLFSSTSSGGKLYDLLMLFKARIGQLTTSGDTQGMLSINDKLINDLLEKILNGSYLSRLCSEIIPKIEQEQSGFLGSSGREMGDDRYLTGLRNGTLEIVRSDNKRKIFYRPASPDDMIDSPINAKYDPNERGTSRWKEVQAFFTRFIADEDTRKWYTCQLAEFFSGYNNKIAVFIVGPPNCGKSLHIKFLCDFLGSSNSSSVTSNALCDPKAGVDNPQPFLAKALPTRGMFSEELTGIIRNFLIKVIVGGTAQFAVRSLFKEGGPIIPSAKPYIAMNQLPRFEYYEEAVLNRCGIITPSCKFLSAGSSEIPPTIEEQERKRIFPRNDAYGNILGTCFDAFLLYLMDHFDAWDNGKGLVSMPPAMEARKKEVRNQCPYATFIEAYVKHGGKMHVKDALDLFRKNSNVELKRVPEGVFVSAISQLLGQCPVGGIWTGRRLKIDDDIESDPESDTNESTDIGSSIVPLRITDYVPSLISQDEIEDDSSNSSSYEESEEDEDEEVLNGWEKLKF